MDTCAVETGLLKKKPCGEKAVTKCANCEIALCAKHATSRMSGGKKIFLCQECARAWKEMGDMPSTPAAAAPAKAAEKPAPAAAKPATVARPALAPKPAAAAPKPAAAPPAKKEEEKKKDDDDAPLEFTPTKK